MECNKKNPWHTRTAQDAENKTWLKPQENAGPYSGLYKQTSWKFERIDLLTLIDRTVSLIANSCLQSNTPKAKANKVFRFI